MIPHAKFHVLKIILFFMLHLFYLFRENYDQNFHLHSGCLWYLWESNLLHLGDVHRSLECLADLTGNRLCAWGIGQWVPCQIVTLLFLLANFFQMLQR